MKMVLGGMASLERGLRRVKDGARKELQAAMHTTGLAVQTTAQRKIQRGAKTGTMYYRIPGDKYLSIRAESADGDPVAFVGGAGSHNLSATHRASAPGESPATDTGGLASSIAVVAGSSKVEVGTGLDYGRYLELGTQSIEPRPWLYPSLIENSETYRKALRTLAENAAKAARP